VLNNELTQRGPDGFYRLDKDKEAVVAYKEFVAQKTKAFVDLESKINYMIGEGYYENFVSQYEKHNVVGIFERAHDHDFSFESYMAISKFYKDYSMDTNDHSQQLEDYADRVAATSLHLARGDVSVAEILVDSMMEQRLQPATPTFFNAGRKHRGELVSCFLLEVDDTINSIQHIIGTCMQLSKIGGGVAVNLSKLRARGEDVKGVQGAAKGIMPVMKLMEDVFSYVDQGGQRKGSGAAYYNIFGWDVLEFLDSKKINADEKIRIKTLSIGLIVPNIFYKLAEENKPLHVFAPHSVYEAYGKHMDDMDMDEVYEDLLSNEKVKKRVVMSARDMLTKIAMTQLESGYPYIMNRSNANKVHALKDLGTIKMSNLCTEIFQLQETSVITDYGYEDIINRDISCNLASMNIVNVMERRKLKETVYEGMIALTAVSDMSNITNAPGVAKANKELHSVGLGVLNLHGFLAKNKIAYESDEAIDFVRVFFAAVNFYSIEKSMHIARDKGETFRGFERSEYAKGTYFEQYKEDHSPRTDKVASLFEGMHIPTPEDWERLAADVKKYGLYHAYRLAVAPTGSISYLQNATPSTMPVVEQIETRTYANSTTHYPMPYLSADNMFFYKSAYNMSQFKVIDLVAEMQKHIDQGISTILHVTSDISTRDLSRYYLYAAKKGLKALYYTRTKNLGIDDCVSCSV